MLRLLLVMAIAFARSSNSSTASPTSPVGFLATYNDGETGLAALSSSAAAAGNVVTVSTLSGGGTWTAVSGSPENAAAGFDGVNVLGTGLNASVAGSRVTFSWTAGTPAAACAIAGAYTGVQAIGSVATATGNTTTPQIGLVTQDPNNVVVAFITTDNAAAFPSGGNGTSRDSTFATSGVDNALLLKDNTSASASRVTVSTGAYGFTVNWSAIAVELRSVSPTRVFYLNNPVQGGSNAGLLDTVAPVASTSTTGWTVGTSVNSFSRQTYNSEIANAGFTSTSQPSGTPVNLGEDCWRISGVTSGTFSAGTWYSSLSVLAVSSGGFQQGRARFRLYRSSNADGTGATEITQGAMVGSQVTELSTTVAQTSSASTQISALTLTSEFLFQQVAWETL